MAEQSTVAGASPVLRVLAYVADLCLALTVVAVALIINFVAGLESGWLFLAIGVVVAVVASIVVHSTSGASPGKRLADLRVVDAHDRGPIGMGASAIRSVVFTVLTPLVYLPGWSVLADSRRRGVHEKASGTSVVDALDETDFQTSGVDGDHGTDVTERVRTDDPQTLTETPAGARKPGIAGVGAAGAGAGAAALGGLTTGGPGASGPADDATLRRIPTPLPGDQTATTSATTTTSSVSAETAPVAEGTRERLAPPPLPPLPDDVPGLRPIAPRFGPPPEGDDSELDAPAAFDDGRTAAFSPAPPSGGAPGGPVPPHGFVGAPPQGPGRGPGPGPAGPVGAPVPAGPPQRPLGPPPRVDGPPAGPAGPAGPVRPATSEAPQRPAEPPAAAPASGARGSGVPIVLRFDDGHSIDVRGDGIIGREPVLPEGVDSARITKHVLVDDTASVSKTHLRFGLTRDELWIEDVGSTNGSAIAHQDSWTELTKGVRYAVEKNSVVHIGQRSFKVFGG